ncbi:MAG: hypothetical protein MI861_03450, partial [Pirellulales bacterium]|nr:hypothetical protein [Pirellulales bacterium]
MNSPRSQAVSFDDLIGSLAAQQVWEFDAHTSSTCQDVSQRTLEALRAPEDFPPIEAAIVPGDRVALAIDPN